MQAGQITTFRPSHSGQTGLLFMAAVFCRLKARNTRQPKPDGRKPYPPAIAGRDKHLTESAVDIAMGAGWLTVAEGSRMFAPGSSRPV